MLSSELLLSLKNPIEIADLINQWLEESDKEKWEEMQKKIEPIIKNIFENNYLHNKEYRKSLSDECFHISWLYILVELITLALDNKDKKAAKIYTLYFYNTFTSEKLRETKHNDKNLFEILWKRPPVAIFLMEIWAYSPVKKHGVEIARGIFEAMPKDLKTNEYKFSPEIIKKCLEENIEGENAIVDKKRIFNLLSDNKENKESKNKKTKLNKDDLAETLQNLQLSPINIKKN